MLLQLVSFQQLFISSKLTLVKTSEQRYWQNEIKIISLFSNVAVDGFEHLCVCWVDNLERKIRSREIERLVAKWAMFKMFQVGYLALFNLFLVIDSFAWLWMWGLPKNIQLIMLEFLKAPFFVLGFSYCF